MSCAVVLITRKPNIVWLDFLKSFTRYDIYIMIDDNSEDYKKIYQEQYPTIHFIQIDNDECQRNGFVGSSTATKLPPVMSWDKAMYYFSHLETRYEHMWFFEDDVFLFSEFTLLKIDEKYKNCDLLTRSHTIKYENNMEGWWHWNQVLGKIDLPWAYSLICICRVSALLLVKVREYANSRKTIFFIEALLNTLAIHNNLAVGTPPQFITVVQGDIPPIEVTQDKMFYVFHPYKAVENHPELRKLLMDIL